MGVKKFFNRIGLLGYILIAMILGVAVGMWCPGWIIRVFVTFNAIFSQFLGFIIPLLILGLVAPAIMDIGHGAGKMLLFTVSLAYLSTLLAGMASYFTSVTFFPCMIAPDEYVASMAEDISLSPYFTIGIPPLMDVTSALVLAFVVGLCVARIKSTALRDVFYDFREVIITVIKNVIVPLLPLYIFGIFSNMTVSGQVYSIMSTFIKVIAVIFALHIIWLVLLFVVGGLIGRRNPWRCLKEMLPAYLTALGTSSSAATIPVTLRQTKLMGVDPKIADFTVPLCATIHMSGSALKLVACALALMMLQGKTLDFGMIMGFISMLGITIVAAPGVPGGVVMASLGLMSSILGFSDADNALMIALYVAMDSFGTACNVTGDGALSLIVNRFFGSSEYRNWM